MKMKPTHTAGVDEAGSAVYYDEKQQKATALQ